MAEQYDYVIIGNSAAGLQALRTLRKYDRQASIAIVDREDCPAYSRVLTPYFIGGKNEKEELFIVNRDFYSQLGVEPLFGQTVSNLDLTGRILQLQDGRQVGYRKLLLALGAEARALSISSSRLSTLRHMADAERIQQLLQGAKTVTAIGAGLVSLPLLSHAGPERTRQLIVGSDRILSRMIDAETAAVIEERLVKQGLQLFKQNDIESVEEHGCLRLKLRSGEQLETDLLVVGKGIVPNTALAKSAGLLTGDGIIIDHFGRTSNHDVYAAGDVAEGSDFISGEPTVQGNWMTAVEQGENAALNMLGNKCVYEGSLKNNITEIFGVDVAAIGYTGEGVRTVVSLNRSNGRFRKVFLDEWQRVIGATLVGETNDSGLYLQLIRTRSVFPGKDLLSGSINYADILRQIA